MKPIPEDTFWDLKDLTELRLNDNALAHLKSGLFDKNLRLEEIYLDGNKLERIFVDFSRSQNINAWEMYVLITGLATIALKE